MKMLERCYAKAPQRDTVLPLIRSILAYPERNLALFTENALRRICAYMDIRTPIYRGSSLGLPAKMDMQDRVIQIVHRMDGELYLNPIGGIELYCPARFRADGLLLRFLRMDDLTYPQFKHPFVPSLSIIDVLMFNSREQLRICCCASAWSRATKARSTGDGMMGTGHPEPSRSIRKGHPHDNEQDRTLVSDPDQAAPGGPCRGAPAAPALRVLSPAQGVGGDAQRTGRQGWRAAVSRLPVHSPR